MTGGRQRNKRNNGKTRFDNEESLIPNGVLPSYISIAFAELYEDDGIAVFGSGLGWLSLLASFVRFYADTEEGHLSSIEEEKKENSKAKSTEGPQKLRKPPLVLVIGLRDGEHKTLQAVLRSWGTPGEMMPTIITNESGQGKDRAEMYKKGGIFCVTSRILIVDLLDKTLLSKNVDGMLIGHAENVHSHSTEAFIIRIYTTQKRRDRCFIKAFTGSPDLITSGFSKIDKILKALQVRNLYLYPRFHVAIQDELEQPMTQPNVHEIHQSLSPAMKKIQTAIVSAVQGCMRELKKLTPFVEWNLEELSIENCVTTAFDRAVARQLEKDWHRMKPQTKQLVTDLKTLRTLFIFLISYDCVTFWKFIQSLKATSAASRYPSLWLFTPVADLLFRAAQERIYSIDYSIVQLSKSSTNDNFPESKVGRLIPILEENPKWRILKSILLEIEEKEENKRITQQYGGDNNSMIIGISEINESATIIVVVKDERTVDTVNSYLLNGRETTLVIFDLQTI